MFTNTIFREGFINLIKIRSFDPPTLDQYFSSDLRGVDQRI